MQLRENSEFVALAHHEHHFLLRLNDRIERLVRNYRALISVNRNVNFFSTGYNYYIQVIPVLIVAPMYIRGEVEFGVITQASIAFSQLLGAFSLIVTQFQSISSFTAVVARLDAFSEAANESDSAPPPPIEVAEGDDGLRFEHVTLESPDSGKVLVEDLTFTMPRGKRMLVTGPGEMAKMAFFRATADLWEHGRGRIERPASCAISFVPERPYLPPGTLRDTLASGECAGPAIDVRVHQVLRALDLEDATMRVGGLQAERDWDDVFSLGELQRFAIARMVLAAPDFVVLDRIETTIEPEYVQDVLRLLDQAGTSYVMIGHGDGERSHYDMVLDLSGNGPWTLHPATRPADGDGMTTATTDQVLKPRGLSPEG